MGDARRAAFAANAAARGLADPAKFAALAAGPSSPPTLIATDYSGAPAGRSPRRSRQPLPSVSQATSS
jgi:hypothetical protein